MIEGTAVAERPLEAGTPAAVVADAEFLPALAHAVRGPLACIQSYCEILLRYPPTSDTKRRAFLHSIQAESVRLQRFMEDMVEITRLESHPGRDPDLDEICDLGEIAERAVLTLHPLITAKSVVVAIQSDEGVFAVRGERERLGRAVFALIDNAVRFSENGGRVEVRVRVGPRAAEVEVDDDGIGIAPEARDHIFERFFRASVPPDDGLSPTGTGLGLYLALLVAERHRGKVRYRAKPKGSRFTLILPQ